MARHIKREAVSQLFNPTSRNASPEALICLGCERATCKGERCERYKKLHKELKEQEK